MIFFVTKTTAAPTAIPAMAPDESAVLDGGSELLFVVPVPVLAGADEDELGEASTRHTRCVGSETSNTWMSF